MVINIDKTLSILKGIASTVLQEKEILTNLDAAIGDGDFGMSLSNGFQKVQEALETMEKETIGDILKKVGMLLTSSVGGVSGPLWGTAFLRAGIKAGAKQQLSISDLEQIMRAALEGIQARGKANLGDKTLVDALYPAIEAFKKKQEEGSSLLKAFESATQAAHQGSDATIDMVAQKGRASYLGERSKGHRDAGSWAIVLIFENILKNLKKMEVK